jgi:hypothetical protein
MFPNPLSIRFWRILNRANLYDLFLILGLTAALFVCCLVFSMALLLYQMPILVFLLFAAGIVLSVVTADGIGNQINVLRQSGNFELLCVSPDGHGIRWALAAHFIKTDGSFALLTMLLFMAQILLLAGVSMMILAAAPVLSLAELLNIGFLFILLRADYVYSIVIGRWSAS